MRSTSLRSRTRKQIRMSIWERTAPWPMAFWVGRWVAAIRVTATARPSRAIESASLAGLGSVLGQLGVLIDDDDQRGHVRGRLPDAPAGRGEQLGAGFQDGHRVGEQRRACSGVVASRSMQVAQGPAPCLS